MKLERIKRTGTVGGYNLCTLHGTFVGNLCRDVDGSYYFWPIQNGSAWQAHLLRAVADELDKLNRPKRKARK